MQYKDLSKDISSYINIGVALSEEAVRVGKGGAIAAEVYIFVYEHCTGPGNIHGPRIHLRDRDDGLRRDPVLLAGRHLWNDAARGQFHNRHDDVRARHRGRVSHRHVRTWYPGDQGL